jgi:hypothetical protein
VDLGIRQMLQYLTNQTQIGVWQRVDGEIRTQKTNAVVAEADLVTSHHGLNDIHADVVHVAARRNSLAHLKVAASEIGNALDASALPDRNIRVRSGPGGMYKPDTLSVRVDKRGIDPPALQTASANRGLELAGQSP